MQKIIKKKKLNKYLEIIFNNYPQLKKFIFSLNKLGDVFLVGGCLRNIYFSKKINDFSVRDIDLIYDIDEEKFKHSISCFKYSQNRFGGYKLFLDNNLEVDIWSYDNSWAIKNKFLTKRRKCKEKILSKGCFYNTDSFIYNFSSKKLVVTNFNNLKNNIVDFTLNKESFIDANPSKKVNIIKALLLIKEYDLKLSKNIVDYILDELNKSNPINELEKLYKAQYIHYKYKVIDEEEIYQSILSLKNKINTKGY